MPLIQIQALAQVRERSSIGYRLCRLKFFMNPPASTGSRYQNQVELATASSLRLRIGPLLLAALLPTGSQNHLRTPAVALLNLDQDW